MKKTRIVSLAMTGALTLTLLAGWGAPAAPNTTPAAGETPAVGAPAAGGTTIKVGILAPLTGGAAQYGIAADQGARLCFDQVNAAGGVNGKQIEYITLDEKGQAADAVTAYSNLVGQGVTAIVGDVTTAPSVAVATQSATDNMPLISGTATGAAFTVMEDGKVRENVFRTCFIDPFQGAKMADYASAKLGAKTAAVIYNTGTDYSVGLKDAFVAKAAEVGLEVVKVEGYADADVDFMSQLTNIAAVKPDVLFCPDYFQKTSLIAQQASDAGLKTKLVGGDGWDGIIEALSDTSFVEGAYFCSGFSKDDTTPIVQDFMKAFKTAYNVDPSMFAAQTYDAANVLCQALTVAEGKGLVAGSAEYKQAVIDAMKATDGEFVTGKMTYDESNNPVKEAVIITVKGGAYTFEEKY